MHSRRQFFGHLGKGAAGLALVGSLGILEGCNVASDIEKVLQLLPEVSGIATSVGNIVSAADPVLAPAVQAALLLVSGGFAIVGNILTSYETNIAAMPGTTLNQLDAAIAAIASQITAIEAQFPNLPANAVAGINAGLASFQAILVYLAAILPAPVATTALPQASAKLAARGIKVGTPATIPSKRAFVQSYNERVSAAGFKSAKIHTPWIKVGPVPVLP